MIKLLLPLLIFINSYSAINTSPTKSMKEIRKDVKSLSKKINNLESSLALKNRTYLQTVKKRQMVDLEAYKIKREISKSTEAIREYKEKINRHYKTLIVSSLNGHDTKSLFLKKVSVNRIRRQKKEIKHLEANTKKLKDVFTGLVAEYQRVIKLEDDLLDSIKNIEESKKSYVKRYVKEKETFEKAKSSSKTRRRSRKKARNSVVKTIFESPLKKHFAYEANGKGITFKTKIKEGIKASKSGNVVYIGTLANFGNVIMIDHGDDLRSIYLGDFNTGIKKDQAIKEGQVIAEVKSQIRKDQFSKIYFEIRKKDKVQDTIKLVKNFKASRG